MKIGDKVRVKQNQAYFLKHLGSLDGIVTQVEKLETSGPLSQENHGLIEVQFKDGVEHFVFLGWEKFLKLI